MAEIPIVELGLLREKCYITDFIQVDNPELKRIADSINATSETEVILQVSRFIAKNIEYPLNYRGRPTAARHIKLFKWWNGFYLADLTSEYGWLFPNQTISLKKGICFDTACLCTTLLRIKNIQAHTVLGAILKTKKKRFLGFHAWTETTTKKGLKLVLETTVHSKAAKPVLADLLYKGKLNITYDPIAWFNEKSFREDPEKARAYEEMVYATRRPKQNN